ncbi:3-phenylpropionate/trans-cinnamate dioxygenase ferredoxin reductase subunit [Tistlia consotensis]|uniref:3-phenylpropionate/trans-cinnamate dioxygenase ferredoxin reductase subunit n=1 Tax=Tistlia consotensis USBA 355 TaxID=560819 RepID=A0A1Y6CHD2_9PROT|nr:FAD-dependent oxidoreductase [Tistlia consotensis]SMF53331.1 3-phenylpropionate/trans-cinnamate dioxygenase ferredoxin reductase subunit [Tistlia consotensis USBA 355]SNR85382.1 3-phenylpropionate/trans-cinnamate dioxygenase ferredoxin reductase subunit [Tistlia consotensis]
MSETAVIVGAGQAGGRTAQALRRQGWQGRILLLGAEPEAPYERPPLSKEVLAEGADPLKAALFKPGQLEELGIELETGLTVEALEVGARRLTCAGGRHVKWDRLVLATGARPRRLACPGAELPGVHLLRSAADARALAPELTEGRELLLVGGGFIGLEVAASARRRGCRVTVVEAAPHLIGRALGPKVSRHLRQLHIERGVHIRLSGQVAAFEGRDRLEGVVLADGTRMAAEVAVVGIGCTAEDGLARAAGLDCDDGILTDAFAATSAPGVWAVGDCTRHENVWLGRRVRLESWENAELAPQIAAKAICGKPEPYSVVPWFWTDQYELNLQLLGLTAFEGELVWRGTPLAGPAIAFEIEHGLLRGAALFDAGRERRPLRQLIEQRVRVRADSLADPAVSLRDLAKASA